MPKGCGCGCGSGCGCGWCVVIGKDEAEGKDMKASDVDIVVGVDEAMAIA